MRRLPPRSTCAAPLFPSSTLFLAVDSREQRGLAQQLLAAYAAADPCHLDAVADPHAAQRIGMVGLVGEGDEGVQRIEGAGRRRPVDGTDRIAAEHVDDVERRAQTDGAR